MIEHSLCSLPFEKSLRIALHYFQNLPSACTASASKFEMSGGMGVSSDRRYTFTIYRLVCIFIDENGASSF